MSPEPNFSSLVTGQRKKASPLWRSCVAMLGPLILGYAFLGRSLSDDLAIASFQPTLRDLRLGTLTPSQHGRIRLNWLAARQTADGYAYVIRLHGGRLAVYFPEHWEIEQIEGPEKTTVFKTVTWGLIYSESNLTPGDWMDLSLGEREAESVEIFQADLDLPRHWYYVEPFLSD